MSGRLISGHGSLIPPKTTHHAKRLVRRGRFAAMVDKPELTTARETWMAVLRPFAPSTPLVGPLRALIDLTWPFRKGDGMRVRKNGRIPCDVKPDCDNMAKTIFDVMALLGYFSNDAQIFDLIVTKWFGDEPGITFHIQEGDD
jgi:Holliday junction resolvase RusA-like endonuclease